MKNDISEQLKEIISDYTDEVREVINDAIIEVGENTAKEFRSAGSFKNRTGKYRRSWRVEKEEGRLQTTVIVHAKSPQARLTHLLEFGHAKKGGGRVKEFPHIAEINEKAQEEAVKMIIERVKSIR